MERTYQDSAEPADVTAEVDLITDLASAAAAAAGPVQFPLAELVMVPREEGPAAEWLCAESGAGR